MLSPDTFHLPALELGAKLRSREISPVELTEGYLERLRTQGAKLNAVAALTPELALEQARQAEAELAAGRVRGPLHGVPYGAKDLLAVKGYPTTWGAAPYRDQRFETDATVIRKLREAGAVLVAKLAMVELAGGLGYSFGNASLQGPMHNPWDPGRWTGGSSSGSAASVSAGLVGFAIGSETWGSIVCPSSFCGVSGLRPTYGRVSRAGAMPLSWNMDKLGPMARSAADCRAILAAISGPDPDDLEASNHPVDFVTPRASVRGLRVGFLQADFSKHGDKEVDTLVHRALKELESLGATVHDLTLPPGPWEESAVMIISVEAVSAFEELFTSGRVKELTDHKAPMQQDLADEIRGRDYLKALRARTVIRSEMNSLFSTVDVIVSCGMQYFATPLDQDFNESLAGSDPLGGIGNLCGLPAVCVPCGLGTKGLPAGIQVVGPAFSEDTILAVAEGFQARTDWQRGKPPGF